MEKWASISGWEGLYEVSTLGRVRSVQRTEYGVTKILKCRGGKYHSVILCRDGFRKSELVHRLVAQAFIPNPDDLPFVDHKDEDKHNNCADNLEWCTRSYNRNYGTCTERQRAKMLGRVVSEETREKLRIAGLGRKHSEATKRKISEAVRRRNDGKMGECLSPENL